MSERLKSEGGEASSGGEYWRHGDGEREGSIEV